MNLLKCAVNGTKLSFSGEADIAGLWNLANRHAVCATVGTALLNSNIELKKELKYSWNEAIYKNIRKTTTFDIARRELFKEF